MYSVFERVTAGRQTHVCNNTALQQLACMPIDTNEVVKIYLFYHYQHASMRLNNQVAIVKPISFTKFAVHCTGNVLLIIGLKWPKMAVLKNKIGKELVRY